MSGRASYLRFQVLTAALSAVAALDPFSARRESATSPRPADEQERRKNEAAAKRARKAARRGPA